MAQAIQNWKRFPRFSVGDSVDFKIGPVTVVTPGNWDQGIVQSVKQCSFGMIYEVKSHGDGRIVECKEKDMAFADS